MASGNRRRLSLDDKKATFLVILNRTSCRKPPEIAARYLLQVGWASRATRFISRGVGDGRAGLGAPSGTRASSEPSQPESHDRGKEVGAMRERGDRDRLGRSRAGHLRIGQR